MMQYGQVKHLEKPVSRFLMGTMILNRKESSTSFGLLDDVFATGVNAFDTAARYGSESECTLGQWIKSRGIREKVVILTKGCHHNDFRKRVTPYDIYSDFHDSLAKLETDYIDIYLLHRDDPSIPVGPIVEALNRLYEAGKLRCFGGSNWTWDRIEEANDYAMKFDLIPFGASSPNYSLAVQVDNPWGPGCVTLSGAANQQERDYYVRTSMPVMAYSSLGRGFFSGQISSSQQEKAREILDEAAQRGYMYPENFERLRRTEILAKELNATVPQIATAWLMNQPLNLYAIVGASNGQQMQDNVDAMNLKISENEFRWLNLEIDMRQ